jgi:hypothetical protein
MSYILSFPLPSHIRKNEVQDRIRNLSNDKRSLRYTTESNTIIIRSSDFNQIVEAKNELETQPKSCITKHGDKYIGKYPIHPDIVSQRLISRTIGRSGCFINEIQSKVSQNGSVHIHVGDKKDNYFYTITALDTKQVENAYELLQKNEFAVLYDTAKQSKHTATVPTASTSDANKKSNGGSSDSSDKLVRKFSISDDIQKYKLFSPLIGQRGSCLDKITSQVKTKSYISVSKDTLEYTIGTGSQEDMETIYGLLIEHEQKVIDSYLAYKQQRQERQRQEQSRFNEESDSTSDDEKHDEVESNKTVECPPSPRKEPRKKTSTEKTVKSSSWADLLDDDEDDEICDILDSLPSIKRD